MGLNALLKKHENKGNFQKTGWFKLVDDGDNCMVRLLCHGIVGKDADGEPQYDFDVHEVHKIEIDGFLKSVKCTGNDLCPFCKKGENASLRIWIPMLNHEEKDAEKKVQLWERGINDVKALIGEVEENGDLTERDYKIKRNGKKGSTKTTYQFFPKDKKEIELPERPQVLGKYVLELSLEDMQKAIDGTLTLRTDNNNSTGAKVNTPSSGEEVF